jgi:hypothetical protein
MSVAELIKAKLLDNGSIRPAEFAVEVGCHREAVRWYTRQMVELGIVEKTRERGLSGRPIEVIRVIHWDGVSSWQPPGGKDPVKYQWEGLMAAFGVRLADIPLPTFTHELAGSWA